MALGFPFQRIFDAALVMLYPASCRVCGAGIESWRDGVACATCWEEIETAALRERRCGKCALPLPASATASALERLRCGKCEEMAFVAAAACGRYRGALRESVLWLKRRPQLAPRLQELLRASFEQLESADAIDSIVPVPLHPDRAEERTFNQAEVIARALGPGRPLQVDAASLIRVRPTEKHRVGMDARERARTMERAFRVRAPRLIEGRNLLLVDDVMTTASTLHEAAETLLAAGAGSVRVLTIARAVPEFLH
ncbi:MAG: ComF family protein [Blastocatellia bacterium]|nr:ComF family protein [Blastocatellia bacterium]